MRRKACGLLVLMLAVASVTACKTGRETGEENIAGETKDSADAQEKEAGEAEEAEDSPDAGVPENGETTGGAKTGSGAPDGSRGANDRRAPDHSRPRLRPSKSPSVRCGAKRHVEKIPAGT